MIESRSEIVLLIDSLARLHGRLRGVFGAVRQATGLAEMEQTVLTAVAEASSPPTVARIGRSLGHPRQVIQRAANALADAGLIAFAENPDHKRAQWLIATPAGKALQQAANRQAEAIATTLLRTVDPAQVRQARALLDTIRTAIEQHEKEPAA